VINAGDGQHEHPTQALLDAATIRRHKGNVAGLEIAIVGDIQHSRVARSNILCLSKLGARVRLVIPDDGHASLHGRLTDNLIQFRTRRYADNPLVVQGPGAGPDVTAAGVFGDILAIAQMLGARV